MAESNKKFFCPRLVDYVIMVGPRAVDSIDEQSSPKLGNHSKVPHLLRRYPPEDHKDFPLPPGVVIFCQPEGCDRQESTPNAYNNPTRSINSFVFLLTEKDTSRVRYGVCLNYYRPLLKCPHRRSELYSDSPTWHNEKQRRSSNQMSSITPDNESGIKISTCHDSDSVGRSSGLTGNSSSSHLKNYNSDQRETPSDTMESLVSTVSKANDEPTDSTLTETESFKQQQVQQKDVNDPYQATSGQRLTPNVSHHHHHPHHHHQHHQQRHGHQRQDMNAAKENKNNVVSYALNSICLISHHPFFSTFRECLLVIRKFIQACETRNMQQPQGSNQVNCRCHIRRKDKRNISSSQLSQSSRRSDQNSINIHKYNCPYSSPIWSLLTMADLDDSTFSPSSLSDVAEIEAWLLRFLSVPVPVPEKTKIELEIMPKTLKDPLLFALPDHTRFSLIDFPLHLPLELLGVQTCLQVLTCILLEHKVALQSKDYNALSMSVMAFVTMIYPLEYMFPVIPLLPSCMSSAEQLLLAPTPFIIGFPSSFFKFKVNFTLPNDVWIVDLDANKVKKPPNFDNLPPLPDLEGTILVQNLRKILNSMSGMDPESIEAANCHMVSPIASSTPVTRGSVQHHHPSELMSLPDKGHQQSPLTPFKRKSSMSSSAGQLLRFAANKLSGNSSPSSESRDGRGGSSISHSPASTARSSIVYPPSTTLIQTNSKGGVFDPLEVIKGDTDAVDVAVRVAMVRFFNSQDVLANFIEHTRTIRLYPRPVVSFQKSSFIQSRLNPSQFLIRLVETQAVEYMAEWALCPDNVAFQRIQTGVYDAETIGDKPKWFGHQLESLKYDTWDKSKPQFYEEICSIIKDSNTGTSGADSSTGGRFSDYYAESDTNMNEFRNTGNYDDEDGGEHRFNNHLKDFTLDINSLSNMDSHSPYISSNDESSPCYSSDEGSSTNRPHSDTHDDDDSTEELTTGRPLTLNDVLNMNRFDASLHSDSSTSSLSAIHDDRRIDDALRLSIPPNYHHEIGRYPPIRCNIEKFYKPKSKLVQSLQEIDMESKLTASDTQTGQSTALGIDKTKPSDSKNQDDSRRRMESFDSSTDDESSRVMQSSSSCDESVTEEFDFASLNPQAPEHLDLSMIEAAMKIHESIDSDTIVPTTSSQLVDDQRPDKGTNENREKPSHIGNNTNISQDKTDSTINESIDDMSSVSSPDLNNNLIDPTAAAGRTKLAQCDSRGSVESSSSNKPSDTVMKVASGVAKLIDRAASMSDQHARPSSTNQRPISPKIAGLTGEQVGSFIGRVASEAKGAVKEAKAAIKADGSGQKLLKNLGGAMTRDQPSRQSENSAGRQKTGQQAKVDLNEFTDKANSIGGWLGSKASGIANKMRDRAFPQMDESVRTMGLSQARRASFANFRRPSMTSNRNVYAFFHQTINETIQEADESISEIFPGQKLVQKTRLIRHSTMNENENLKGDIAVGTTQNDADNRQFINEVTRAVMEGNGIGWLKQKQLKKLMADESYRNLALSAIYKDSSAMVANRPDEDKICDVEVSESVWRGIIRVCIAIVSGLEQSYSYNKLAGMASVFTLLELAHTHYWARHVTSQTGAGSASSLRKRLSISSGSGSGPGSGAATPSGRPSISNPLGSQTIAQDKLDSVSEMVKEEKTDANIQFSGDKTTTSQSPENPSGSGPSSCEPDDNVTAAPQLVKQPLVWNPKAGLPAQLDHALASGITLMSQQQLESQRLYVYEGIVNHKDRSWLWDEMQFWEEAFLDAVSHERCLTGMDQGPSEMLERYKLLYEMDRKRLEHEEDRLLSTLLYNMTSFMVMLQVDKMQTKQKIRRLLGKCHIGLVNSGEINHLLEQIDISNVRGNDIDLKQVASRQVRRQTFTIHHGVDATGPIVFMEIRDDGLVLRGLDGIIIERWWYERLINMTYSPKSKIICFWRKADGQTKLDKFYTKKCHDLYSSIKESMQQAAASRGSNRVCSELGGEFPVLDVKSGEGGILQVCLDGVGLLFATSKYFVRLENIRKCFTQKGGTFVLEELNPKNGQLTERYFRSQMADQICYAILCVFSYVAAGQNKQLERTAQPQTQTQIQPQQQLQAAPSQSQT